MGKLDLLESQRARGNGMFRRHAARRGRVVRLMASYFGQRECEHGDNRNAAVGRKLPCGLMPGFVREIKVRRFPHLGR